MSKRTPKLLVEDIFDSINKINDYTRGLNFDEFVKDDKTTDAVIRNFEIIGEASGRLPDDFRLNNPQIEWDKLRGFRNRIVHDYFGIDYEIVWNIIRKTLPEFENQIKNILNNWDRR